MRRFDLFIHGEPTELTGEWRHAGNFEAPHVDGARQVAWRFMESGGHNRVRVFTGTLTSTIGRMVADLKYSD